MDIKSYAEIEITKNDRVYHFFMPVGAPYGEAYDAAFEALTKITELAKTAVENAKPQEAKEPEEVEAVPSESKK